MNEIKYIKINIKRYMQCTPFHLYTLLLTDLIVVCAERARLTLSGLNLPLPIWKLKIITLYSEPVPEYLSNSVSIELDIVKVVMASSNIPSKYNHLIMIYNRSIIRPSMCSLIFEDLPPFSDLCRKLISVH